MMWGLKSSQKYTQWEVDVWKLHSEISVIQCKKLGMTVTATRSSLAGKVDY